MALPPTIPTSFVPRQPIDTAPRSRKSGTNLFLYGALGLLGLTIVASGVTFGYQAYLTSVRDSKATQLQAAQKNISSATVEQFIRLRDRLSASKDILNQHIALSQLFDALGTVTLATVHFDTFKASIADDRTGTIELAGIAKDFNALAAQSAGFANDQRFKRAIFSNFQINKDGTVAFTLDAVVDKTLIVAVVPSIGAPAAPVASTTPAATPKAGTTTSAAPAAQAPKAATSSPVIQTPPNI